MCTGPEGPLRVRMGVGRVVELLEEKQNLPKMENAEFLSLTDRPSHGRRREWDEKVGLRGMR
jgi:hypothetical protein